MAALPLLSLLMMVKDEAKSLRASFDSVRGVVDRALILDTGSTDGTQALARELFTQTPGTLVEEPFVDFATSRNRALELCTGQSVFALLLSGDETLTGGASLRAFSGEHRSRQGDAHGAYSIAMRLGSLQFDSARLVRLDQGWRYVGVVHEVLCKPSAPPPSIRVPGCSIVHDLAGRDPERKRQAWLRDLQLLQRAHQTNSSDGRTAFYLAQTLEDLGRHAEALAAYQRRVDLGGWREEVYEAAYRMGRCAEGAGLPWTRAQELYLNAFELAPHRAEPLCAIALHWQRAGNHALAFLFGQRAMQLPFPTQDTLFVQREIYDHLAAEIVGAAAWYVGELEIGERALRQALAARPDAPELLRNLDFYLRRKG
jgi:tetratricopeptide (TPR) repeat protein